MPHTGTTPPPPIGSPVFHTTRWSVVLAARSEDAAHSSAALEHLCRTYWPPLYGYVRRLGHDMHDAQDLTQEFFARLLAKEWLHAADRDKGRFRTFLLVAMKRFLANEWDRARAQKRGSGQPALNLDTALIESQCAADSAGALSADHLYEQRWALTLLAQVMARLRAEYDAAGRLTDYDILKPCLTAARGDIPYDELAKALGVEPASARSSVHRLRKRFREVFREEVAGTVSNPADVDDEMRAVVAALGHA
ncbi:MAG TPA: sigma-70 family RNA polymerase sigma factor [Verrucomicrobiae bacterium]